MRRQRKSDARAELLPKGTLFFSWKTQGWVLREATSSTSDQNQVFCLKTAPGLGVVLAVGRDGQVSLEGEEYVAQRGISAAQQLLESQPGMSWRDVSHQSLPRTPSSVHSVHMELVFLFSSLRQEALAPTCPVLLRNALVWGNVLPGLCQKFLVVLLGMQAAIHGWICAAAGSSAFLAWAPL